MATVSENNNNNNGKKSYISKPMTPESSFYSFVHSSTVQ